MDADCDCSNNVVILDKKPGTSYMLISCLSHGDVQRAQHQASMTNVYLIVQSTKNSSSVRQNLYICP